MKDWLGYRSGMSVAEIKEELKAMSDAERAEIARTLLELAELQKQTAPRVREVQPDDPDFRAAADDVFSKYRNLLQRLAK
jgi:DNA-binding transcriptional MerR regulator